MKQLTFVLLLFNTYFSLGQKNENWDSEKIQNVIEYAKEIGTYALVIQTDGQIIASEGNIDKVSRVHSIRKAIIGALVFQNLNTINLHATLKDLKIQDFPISLTKLQRQTKVLHLLKSTSGINHPTGSQIGKMQKDRDLLLGNKSNIPGTKWAYNNWDYNVLTTILEEQTRKSTSELFEKGIGKLLEINEFEVIYRSDTTLSKHAKAGFRLSTRDMAKFGQLFLNKGKWGEKQLIPREWIERITTDFTLTTNQSNERYGHGYLWWIHDRSYAEGLLPEGSFVATGAWGQRILVIPEWNTVIAHKVMTEIPSKQRKRVTRKEFEQLIILISKSRI
ncbi:serine hydrolase domain-containing protein [Aquimarina megaterium]|uniref:serine hydrolase domain-containing protein n=1 Tax=Aquimarina megaterium TaxID=1443666 RepID=UPI0009434210|nr:serine hydrolase [Aquimarina megaterium]